MTNHSMVATEPSRKSTTTEPETAVQSPNPGEMRMQMLYGVNQADQCWDFARGAACERIQERLREIDTRMIRLFLFDKSAPDPVREWLLFASYVQAVLDVGAVPMITFAKLRRPLDDPRAIRWFATQCSDVVWSCIEQWGGEVVRDWYWCVWNEPNNAWISGPVTFEQYRRLYEAVAQGVLRWLAPYLGGRKPLIGGPAVEGFQPFWMDWVWRFLNEIDNELIGFLDWHCYGDWREHGEHNAPVDGATHRRLLMGLIGAYQHRARVIGQLLAGRGMLNICGELNCHSHYTEPVRARFNYSIFGATFYISALLQLMRAQVDAEMFWVGTEAQGGYGMLNQHGDPWPAFYAKKLCAQHIRYGDWITFPTGQSGNGSVDVVVARGQGARRSAVIVHQKEEPASYDLAQLIPDVTGLRTVLKIDNCTNNQIMAARYDRELRFDGFGVAAVTTAS